MFIQKHPNFIAMGHKASIEELTDEVIFLATRHEGLKHIRAITSDLSTNSITDLGDRLLLAARAVLELTPTHDSVDFKKSPSSLTQYLKELKMGKQNTLKYMFNSLDNATGGMAKGELIVISGRPEMGKSSLGRRLAGNLFKQGANVLIMTLEESLDQYRRRLYSMLYGISYNKMKNQQLDQSEIDHWQKMEYVRSQAKGNMFILGGKMTTSLTDITACLEKYKPDAMLIDGAYMMKVSRSSQTSFDWQQQAVIFNEIKKMALDYKIPIIAITQAGRQLNQKDPKLEDMAYTDHIGRVADVAIYITDPQDSPIFRTLTLSKNRDGIRLSKGINLQVDFDLLRFTEI